MSGGKFEFDDGGFYVGEWQNGQANGYGVSTGPSNIGKFEGLWKLGVEVSGVYSWPDGTQHKGEWKDGSRNGVGIEINGSFTYSGEWLNGLKHGSGIIQTGKKMRSCFEGTWKNGLQDGHGVEIYKDGGYYAGQWKEGHRHGIGIRGCSKTVDLQDGSTSILQLITSSSNNIKSRPSAIAGVDALFDLVLEDTEDRKLKKTHSTPVSLNKECDQSHLQVKGVKIGYKPSVLQKIFHKNQDVDQAKSEQSCDMYKGFWEEDVRQGFGICFYEDGSQYIGEWKVNKRHGYGLFIDKDGRKSGGKWYNDNLLLMTRRRNLTLPMIKKKMNRIILAAMDACERGTQKARLAITRGLSAKKIAVTANDIANLADINVQKAVEFRQKYTLHPCLQATLAGRSCRDSTDSEKSYASTTSLQMSPRKTSLNTSVHALPAKETLRKKSSMLGPLKSYSENNIDTDIINSLGNSSIRESALFSVKDTTIVTCAMSPYVSQMILMQHNDAQTRRTNALLQKHDQGIKNSNLVGAAILPIFSQVGKDNDKIDGGGSKQLTASESSSNSLQSVTHKRNGSNGNVPYFHPDVCTVPKCKLGVACNSFYSSGTSITSEETKMVKMRGKLLSGDDIDYEYAVVNTNMDGKETLILHTNHPSPRFVKDHTISEQNIITSSTGLYRTLVGDLPSVLNVSQPSGIEFLDRGDSIDSGNANDDISGNTSPRDNLLENQFQRNQGASLPEKLNLPYKSSNQTLNNSMKSNNNMQSLDRSSNVPFSFSPSCDELNRKIKRFSRSNSENIITSPGVRKKLDSGIEEDHFKSENTSRQFKDRRMRNNVNVVPRSSLKQVVIHQSRKTKEVSSQTLDNCAEEKLDESKMKTNTVGWLSKHLWINKGNTSIATSLRSLSTDSGYKQSIDDQYVKRNSQCEPINENPSDNHCVRNYNNVKASGVMGTTVVTIENDKFRKLHSIEAQPHITVKDCINFSKSLDLTNCYCHERFDPNKTLSIESSPNITTKPRLPRFYSSPTVESNLKNDYEVHPMSEICDEYVILEDEADSSRKDEHHRPYETLGNNENKNSILAAWV